MTNFDTVTTAPECLLKNLKWIQQNYGGLVSFIDWEAWLKADTSKAPFEFFKDAQWGDLESDDGNSRCALLDKCSIYGQDYARIAVEQDGQWLLMSVPAARVRVAG